MDSHHLRTPPSVKSKLPIKRKTLPHHHPPSSSSAAADVPSLLSPLKFPRIWTEPDEIRFLQGLHDSASRGLVFPRDLHIFYDRFSSTMSQPYTKSRLSEKLRRLRKKFRVISSGLARGLNLSMLSQHDRALYDLSKKLWSPNSSSISPFVVNPGLIKVDDDPITDSNLGEVAAKTVVEVFDQCVKEARMSVILHRTLSQAASISGQGGKAVGGTAGVGV